MLSACFDDKGNYSYTQINDVTIGQKGFDGDTVYLLRSDVDDLKISPELSYREGQESAGGYSYEWVAVYQQACGSAYPAGNRPQSGLQGQAQGRRLPPVLQGYRPCHGHRLQPSGYAQGEQPLYPRLDTHRQGPIWQHGGRHALHQPRHPAPHRHPCQQGPGAQAAHHGVDRQQPRVV